MASSKDMILAALSKLSGGSSPKRFKALDRGSAVLVIQDAVDELMNLRAELKELYCRYCDRMFPSESAGAWVTCPRCTAPMTSMSHSQLKALRAQVLSLEANRDYLETVISAFSDFSPSKSIEGL